MLPLNLAAAAVFCSALVVFLTRAFPFLLFTKRKPPRVLAFIEKYIPPLVMAILLVYCFRAVDFTAPPYGIPALASLLATTLLHLWKSNALVSIFSGTALYMVLIRLCQGK
jgi:branched-subunit amino acid transport protein AzlD